MSEQFKDPSDKIEKVSKVSSVAGAQPATEIVERVAPNKEHFNSLMQRTDVAAAPEQAQKTSFMDEIRDLQKKVNDVSQASPDTIIQKSNQLIAQMEEAKSKLAQPGAEIGESSQALLKNKLSHIDEGLKSALNRAGVEYTAPVAAAGKGSVNPIERFLGFLTHSQYQLQNLSKEVSLMHLNKTEISPASMLAMQLKMGYVTQEVEFFTAILNKSLESTKTIMNVQV